MCRGRRSILTLFALLVGACTDGDADQRTLRGDDTASSGSTGMQPATVAQVSSTRGSDSSHSTTTPPLSIGERLFDPIATVVTHPRCINCHQVDFPRQKDAGVRHAQQVVRGEDGHGAPTLQCAACHQLANSADGRVPGAPHWHLAPLSMKWEGLSKAQLCQQLKDPRRNGNRRGGEAVIEHMKVDPLVLWAWNPGANRTLPPMSHAEFLAKLSAWAEAGMPCPA